LNNKNLNISLNINAKKIQQYKTFLDIFLNFRVREGLIDIDETKFSWGNYVNFEILDSALHIIENQLILNGRLLANTKDYNEIYKFLQMPRNLRPKLNKLEFNFNYNLNQQIMNINSINVNGHTSEKVNKILNKIILKENRLQNKIYLKNLIKKAITAYVG
jgi:hypothetical protein